MTEEQLHAQCATWFWNEYRFTEHKYALHYNNNNSLTKVEGNRNKSMGVRKGVSDFELITFEVIVFIEMKLPNGKQSTEQKEFQQYAEELGHPYKIIYSFEEFKQLIICNIGKS